MSHQTPIERFGGSVEKVINGKLKFATEIGAVDVLIVQEGHDMGITACRHSTPPWPLNGTLLRMAA